MTILQASNLSVKMRRRAIVTEASLTLFPGQFSILVGPNGAGKTTLMRALAGLIRSKGHIVLKDRELSSYSQRERALSIAYLPQGHTFDWPLNVASIVALGRHPHADAFTAMAKTDLDAVQHALEATGTTELAKRNVTSLSGGERARVALARVLATEADILFADEPTASLDPRHQLVVMELLRGIANRGGAVLAIVHDLGLAARFADRVLVMQNGMLVGDSTPNIALSEARLAEVFGVRAVSVETGEGRVPLPLRPI